MQQKILMLGKIEGKRRRGQQRMRLLDSIADSMDMNLSKLRDIVKNRKPGMLLFMGSQRVRHDCVTEQQASTIKKITSTEASLVAQW